MKEAHQVLLMVSQCVHAGLPHLGHVADNDSHDDAVNSHSLTEDDAERKGEIKRF